MSLHIRRDSDGVIHQVMEQQQAASCGVASIWMARCIAKRATFSEGEWSLAWRVYHRAVRRMDRLPAVPAPMTLNPDMHGSGIETFGDTMSNAGLLMSEVTTALKADGVSVHHVTLANPHSTVIDANRIGEGWPAIALVGWFNGTTRIAGHFVVAARRTQAGRIVYLDPAGGRLVEGSAGPGYDAPYSSLGRFEQIAYLSA